MQILHSTELELIDSNLDAMPPPWCEYLIDGYCPCIAMCALTEMYRDCCGCETCCFCDM